MEKPCWLDEEPEITAVLSKFLDKLDRKPAEEWKQPPEYKLTEKTFPSLFKLDDNAGRQWELIQSLEPEIYQVRVYKKRPLFEPEFNNARLVLSFKAESDLRLWFDRPQGSPPSLQWMRTVSRYANEFPGNCELLLARRFSASGLSTEDILKGLLTVRQYQDQVLTLRQLSALCYQGYSKVLDHKQEIVQSLYPDLVIKPRPLLVSVHLPQQIDDVLFIENQDTYNTIITVYPDCLVNTALVYCAGFKGSAQYVRESDGVSLHYQGNMACQAQFEAWWFAQSGMDWRCYFWGDLDYSGMAILKALRQRFTTMQAWQKGYEAMSALLEQGDGYYFLQSNKLQTDPLETGCHYADAILLPLLRKHKRFMDQEIVI